MTTTSHHTPTHSDVGRGFGALLLLILFVIGAPTALLALAPTYLPTGIHSAADALNALTAPDDGSLLFAALALIAWIAWAIFTASVLVEIAAGARRLPTPPLPGLGSIQLVAARLVATAGVLFTLTTSITAAAGPSTAAPISHAQNTVAPLGATTTDDPTIATPMTAPESSAPIPVAALPTVIVSRGDTLWDLAERHLGDGARFTEIGHLNVGRAQPDGQSLTDAHWIYPGWILLLPADATGTAAPPASAPSNPPAPTDAYVVQPGDTLSGIAEAHLGGATRYTEIVSLNAGRPQPNGQALSDPDLIQPGWALLLPSTAVAAPAAANTLSQPSTAEAVGTAQLIAGGQAGQPARSLDRIPAHLAPRHDDVEQQPKPTSGTQAPFYVGLTALAAAGVVGELSRRRHLQHRARKVGESIPMPDPHGPAAVAEQSLRSASAPVTLAQLRTTLLNLDSRCYEAERDLPRIAALTLDEHALTLHLDSEDPEPVPPFAAQDARTWTATTDEIADETLVDDAERSEPYPALVTLGHSEAGTVLLNLEAAGTLSIVGDDDVAEAVLRAIAMELVTSDLSGRIGLVAEPWLHDLAEAIEPTRFQATDEHSPTRAARTAAIARALRESGLDDTLDARSDRVLPDIWLPVVFLEREPNGPKLIDPWSGSVLVTRLESDGWTLTVTLDGLATLEPLGISFRAQRLSVNDLEHVQSLLSTAQPPNSSAIAAARTRSDAGIQSEVDAVNRAMDEQPKPPEHRAAARIHVNVLGPIQIEGLARPDSPPPERITELLVYLALRRSATFHEIDEVFWPGKRVDPGTRNTFVYRTRQFVGDDVLPPSTRGAPLRVTNQVTSDWACFENLTAHAVANEASRVEDLTSALALVRARPFLGINALRYAWAEADIQQMISAIADVAHILSRVHFDDGDFSEALRVAKHGLTVEPFSELLQCDALDAASARGGDAEQQRLKNRFAMDLAELDPDATP